MIEPGRLITAMVTPFTEDDRVDFDTARRLAVALIESGSDGLVVAGSTGEGVVLSKEEKVELFREVKDAVGDRYQVIANTGNYDTRASIELSAAAARTGVDALLLTVPYYNKPPQAGLHAHFVKLAGSVELPAIIYNVPSRTVTDIDASVVVALSHECSNLIGIKESSGNFDKAAAIIDGAREGFLLWSGDDNITLPLMSVGAYGVVSVAAHLVGRQISKMIDAHLAGRNEEAAAVHRRLLPLIHGLFLTTNPIPLKYALAAAGLNVGGLRLPLVPADESIRRTIDGLLAGQTVDLLAEPAPAF